MVVDADRTQDQVRAGAGQDGATFFKSSAVPRITRVGRIIRRTSVDELPQLFNVLRREMSMVGPRPLTQGEGDGVPGFVERRMLVRPDITGLWQVSGRSDLSESDRIRLDLFYVSNWSMVQDLLTVGKTVQGCTCERRRIPIAHRTRSAPGSHRAGRDRTRQKLRRGRSAGTGSPVVSQISVES